MIYMFLSNNPLSGDINSSNLPCYPLVLTFVMGAQKNRLIEAVLLSAHNICFR